MATEEKLETAPQNSNLEEIRKNVLKLLDQERVSDALELTKQGVEIAKSLESLNYRKEFLSLLDEIEKVNERETKSRDEEIFSEEPIEPKESSLPTPPLDNPFIDERESSERIEAQIAEVIGVMKDRGYTVAQLSHSTGVLRKLDLVGLKILTVTDSLDVILVVPLKISRYRGVFMVDKGETSYRLSVAPGQSSSSKTYLAHAVLDSSLNAISDFPALHGSFAEKKGLYRIVRKFTSNALKTKRSILLQPVYYHIGDVEQRVQISPLFIAEKVIFLDRQLNFAYQKYCNLRYCSHSQLPSVLEYIEQKASVIEEKHSDSIVDRYENLTKKTLLGSRLASLAVIVAMVSMFISVCFDLSSLELFICSGIGLSIFYVVVLVGLIAFASFKSSRLARTLRIPRFSLVLEKNDPVLLYARSIFSKGLQAQFQYEVTQAPTFASKARERKVSVRDRVRSLKRKSKVGNRRKQKRSITSSYPAKNRQYIRGRRSSARKNNKSGNNPERPSKESSEKRRKKARRNAQNRRSSAKENNAANKASTDSSERPSEKAFEERLESNDPALINEFAKKHESFLN